MVAAFHGLKKTLAKPPVLFFPDFEEPLLVEREASSVSLGSVLSQKKEDGRSISLQFASRTMTSAEQNRSACEKEALAVMLYTGFWHLMVCFSTKGCAEYQLVVLLVAVEQGGMPSF